MINKSTTLLWLSAVALSMASCSKKKETPEQPDPEPRQFKKISATVMGGSLRDDFAAALATADGGYLLAGSTDSQDGDFSGLRQETDGFVIKYNAAGAIVWKKYFGGNKDDEFTGITATPDGGYLLTGWSTSSNGDVPGNKGQADYWLLKISGAGNKQWSKSYGGSGTEYIGLAVTTADGGYLVPGTTYSKDGDVTGQHGNGTSDGWILKLNSSGDLEWKKTFGGSGDDYTGMIRPTADGSFLISGSSDSDDGDVSGGAGEADGWLFKCNAAGAIIWSKLYGGSKNDYLGHLLPTTDGGYLVTGSTSSNDGLFTGNKGDNDALVMKVNNAGAVIWRKLLGGKQDDFLGGLIPVSDGSFLVAGDTDSPDGDIKEPFGNRDGWLVQLSEKGELLWSKIIGGTGPEYLNFIIRTTKGQFITGGFSQSTNHDLSKNQGFDDAWTYTFE